jgi:hypothetical protein
MNSIFDEPDRNEEAVIASKLRLEDIHISDLQVYKEGWLRMCESETVFRRGYFYLYYDRLIYCDDETSRVAMGITSIKWKRIEPFAETDP